LREVEGQLGFLVQNGEHEVDRLRADDVQGAFDAGDLSNPRNGRQTPVRVLLPDALFEGAVLLDDIGVVDIGDEQDLPDATRRQGAESIKAMLKGVNVHHRASSGRPRPTAENRRALWRAGRCLGFNSRIKTLYAAAAPQSKLRARNLRARRFYL
jgi:hypothetical protein